MQPNVPLSLELKGRRNLIPSQDRLLSARQKKCARFFCKSNSGPILNGNENLILMHLQICRFCWNKIRTEGSGNCPACRSPYAENPADFKPLTAEELARIKAEKRQRDHAKKQKISENRYIFRLLLAFPN